MKPPTPDSLPTLPGRLPRKRRVGVISHTHWDREWYLPFQEFRWKLVSLIDELLEALGHSAENVEYPGDKHSEGDDAGSPEFRCFMLDGQTILLEDYLELRPNRRQALRSYVSAGRIMIGPWYVLPDEFLVSGEALIRNLLLGDSVAREFGEPMRVGYLPDQFGHVSQMPQILRGFGFDSAVIWRGIGDEPGQTEFLWEAPDGSRVFTLHLPTGYFNGQQLPLQPEQLIERVRTVIERLAPLTQSDYVVLMNGGDHQFVQAGLPTALAGANARLEDVEITHYCLPELLEEIKKSLAINNATLAIVQGELRDCRRAHLLPGVYSSRIWIKQRNATCENLLEKWAEPLSAWATVEGPTNLQSPDAEYGDFDRTSTDATLKLAWKHLLQNHPHDSICGCSVDQVHDEMVARFNWSEGLAEGVARQAMERIVAHVDTSKLVAEQLNDTRREERFVVVFNPVEGPRSDFVTVLLRDIGGESFSIVDERGKRYPCQILVQRNSPVTSVPEGELGFVAMDVPGHGYRTFRVDVDVGVPIERTDGITDNEKHIENEYFRVEVDEADGTLRVLDKRANVWYEDLNLFVDGGDAGDEYNYDAPLSDALVSKPHEPPRVSIADSGPCRVTLRVDLNLQVPRGLSADRASRSNEAVVLPVTAGVTLYPGVPRIDIRTEVDNQAKDHRLRVHFPTGIDVDHSRAEGHFAVERRPVDTVDYSDEWVETPMSTYPQKGFVDISDETHGLMVANRGLPEYEALRSDRGVTIALTLLRSTGWLSRDDLRSRRGPAGPVIPAPGGQSLGKHVFDYSLIPHSSGWQHASSIARQFGVPMRAQPTRNHIGHLPVRHSFVRVEPDSIVMSSVKLADSGDAVIVRFYNPTHRPVEAKVYLHRRFKTIHLANLREEATDLLARDASEISIAAAPSQIITLRLGFGQA